jgi:hypothetical protein
MAAGAPLAKLGATRTRTTQLECANLLDFRGLRRVLLYRVSARIALITRKSSAQMSHYGALSPAPSCSQRNAERERTTVLIRPPRILPLAPGTQLDPYELYTRGL